MPPHLPSGPEPSKKMLLVAVGDLSVGIVIAVGIVLLLILDQTIKRAKDFETQTGLRTVAVLPKMTGTDPLQTHLELLAQQQVFQLLTRWFSQEGTKIHLLASVRQGEGKHHLASILQQTARLAGKKVWVIDADWVTGFSPHLRTGWSDWQTAFRDGAFLGRQADFLQELATLKTSTNAIVVLASPMETSTDYQFWLRQADTAYLVFGAGRNITRADSRLFQKIQEGPAHFAGCLLNQVEAENLEDYLGGIPAAHLPKGWPAWAQKLPLPFAKRTSP